jgi:hypothetical protein
MKLPKARNLTYYCDYNRTPSQVLAEIEANISKSNPNIGYTQSSIIKDGKFTCKFAIVYQILNAATQEHHHFVLNIQTFKRTKAHGWQKYDDRDVSLDDENEDEIGFLTTLIDSYKQKVAEEPKRYGIIAEEDYAKLNSNYDANDFLENPENYQKLIQEGGSVLLASTLEWVIENENSVEVIEKLRELDVNTLQDISSITGLSNLKNLLDIWNNNISNASEEFWQQVFERYSWCISMLFAVPTILQNSKAYVGGKKANNREGKIVDFLYKNQLTDNVALIEIKTPQTSLLGNSYRQTYSLSHELSGAINQTLQYKHTLQINYTNLIMDIEDEEERFHTFNPKAILIAGNYSNEILSKPQKESFELFRTNNSAVEIITFDEVFYKVRVMIQLLEDTLKN